MVGQVLALCTKLEEPRSDPHFLGKGWVWHVYSSRAGAGEAGRLLGSWAIQAEMVRVLPSESKVERSRQCGLYTRACLWAHVKAVPEFTLLAFGSE